MTPETPTHELLKNLYIKDHEAFIQTIKNIPVGNFKSDIEIGKSQGKIEAAEQSIAYMKTVYDRFYPPVHPSPEERALREAEENASEPQIVEIIPPSEA